MNQEALKKLDTGVEILEELARELSGFSRAFDTIGNTRMSDSLALIVQNIDIACDMIKKGRSEALLHAVKISEEATNNMVRAALAATTASIR